MFVQENIQKCEESVKNTGEGRTKSEDREDLGSIPKPRVGVAPVIYTTWTTSRVFTVWTPLPSMR